MAPSRSSILLGRSLPGRVMPACRGFSLIRRTQRLSHASIRPPIKERGRVMKGWRHPNFQKISYKSMIVPGTFPNVLLARRASHRYAVIAVRRLQKSEDSSHRSTQRPCRAPRLPEIPFMARREGAKNCDTESKISQSNRLAVPLSSCLEGAPFIPNVDPA